MTKQLNLIESENHWTDMPEFIQEKKEPFAQIIVRFDSK